MVKQSAFGGWSVVETRANVCKTNRKYAARDESTRESTLSASCASRVSAFRGLLLPRISKEKRTVFFVV